MENFDQNIQKLSKELFDVQLKFKEFEENKKKFDLLLNHIQDILWFLDLNARITYVSPSIYQILGYSEEEFKATPVLDFCFESTALEIKKWVEARKNGMANEVEKHWNLNFKHKNGNSVWLETISKPVLDEHGKYIGSIGVSRDISSKIRIENALLENEAYLNSLFENTLDMIWSVDQNYCIKSINTNFKNQFKSAFGVELIVGASILDFLPEPLNNIWKGRYEKALGGEAFTITDRFDIEGVAQYVEVRFNPIWVKGEVISVSVFSRDITEQELVKKNLIESDANQKAILENTSARIWSVDTAFKIIVANNHFKKDYLLAFQVSLERGTYAMKNLSPEMESDWKSRYSRALLGERFSVIDEFHFDGVPNFTETLLNPIWVGDQIIGVTCLSHDISEQMLAQEALKESELRYKSLISSLPNVIYQCLPDRFWTMKFISQEIFNLSGYRPEELIDNKIIAYLDIIHPDDRNFVEEQGTEQLNLGKSFSLDYRIIHKSGDVKWVHEKGRGTYNDHHEISTIIGSITDITPQKRAEEELFNNERKFRFLTNASVELLSLKTKDKILDYLSQSLQNQLQVNSVVVFAINETSHLGTLKSISCLNQVKLQQVTNVLGDIHESRFSLPSKLANTMHKATLEPLEHGCIQQMIHIVPSEKARILETLILPGFFYVIGIKQDDQVIAAILIYNQKPIKNEDVGFVESFTNLTGIILRQQILLDTIYYSEEKLRSIFDNSNAAISIHDAHGFLMVNKAWERITGYTTEESKTLKSLDLVHPQERDRIKIITENRLNGLEAPTNYIFPLIDKNSNEKWIDISASVIDYEGTKTILAIGNDITDRIKSDLEIIKLSTAIINVPLSIMITDIEATIEYVNPYFCELTGYTTEEIIGTNPSILQSGETPQEVFKNLWSTILKGEVWNGEFINKKKNGEVYHESARITPILDNNGIIINFLAIKEDITERIINLRKVEESERAQIALNTQKDKFFSIIAHDLRSPFSGVVGLTTLLKENHREFEPDLVDYYLNLINQSTQHVLKLLENLLTWARTQTGKMEFKPQPLSLNIFVDENIEVQKLTADNKKITLANLVDTSVFIYGDANMLSAILRNLISNALKYTHPDGKIEISSTLKKFNEKPFVIVAVKDSGIGMSKEKMHKIFKLEENYSTPGTEKEKGTGLGLILCKEFVEIHGGKIWCESTEGVGSIFYFSLPLHA
jgi:PAS domain S-box-containing protein